MICQYGNCYEEDTPIVISHGTVNNKRRERFCTWHHAARFAAEKYAREVDDLRRIAEYQNSQFDGVHDP